MNKFKEIVSFIYMAYFNVFLKSHYVADKIVDTSEKFPILSHGGYQNKFIKYINKIKNSL